MKLTDYENEKARYAKKLYKTNKEKYDEVVEGRIDYLKNMYLIGENGDDRGTINLENFIFKMKDKYYFRSDNSLVLFSLN